MPTETATIFFDVNETLTDLGPVADAFDEVGAGRQAAATWFATVLRDGFALTTTGADASFADIARADAGAVLRTARLDRPLDDAVDAVMDAFANVRPHADVGDGIRSLRAAGHRLFTLTNGATAVAERVFEGADLLEAFEELLSVDGHSPWKPARAAYLDALARTRTVGAAWLVAVHPWDIHGAAAAGMSTAWVNRAGAEYPQHFLPPTVEIQALGELVAHLAR